VRKHRKYTHQKQRKNNGITMKEQRQIHNNNTTNKATNVCRIYARLTPLEANKLNRLTQGTTHTTSSLIRKLIKDA
jgi:hypothetical protein